MSNKEIKIGFLTVNIDSKALIQISQMLNEIDRVMVFSSFKSKCYQKLIIFNLGESTTVDDSIWWLMHRNVIEKLKIDELQNKSKHKYKTSSYEEENINYESDTHHVCYSPLDGTKGADEFTSVNKSSKSFEKKNFTELYEILINKIDKELFSSHNLNYTISFKGAKIKLDYDKLTFLHLETPKIDFKLDKHLQRPAHIDFLGFKLTTNMTIRPVMELLKNLMQFDLVQKPKPSIKTKLQTQYEQYLSSLSNSKSNNKATKASNSKFQSLESTVNIDSFLNQKMSKNYLSTTPLINMTKPDPKRNQTDNSDMVLNASSKYSFEYFDKRGEEIAYKEASRYVSNSRPHKYKKSSNNSKVHNESNESKS